MDGDVRLRLVGGARVFVDGRMDGRMESRDRRRERETDGASRGESVEEW
jgi:hypothetical protein